MRRILDYEELLTGCLSKGVACIKAYKTDYLEET